MLFRAALAIVSIVMLSRNSAAVELDEPELTESSGLAWSAHSEHHLWTHNDSGGRARLFAFDVRTGKRTAICELSDVVATDWEAMASFVDEQGTSKLIVADCGDNQSRRDHFLIHVFDEPDIDADSRIAAERIVSVRVRHAGGPMDCEAVAVDSQERLLLLVGKSRLPLAVVASVPLSEIRRGGKILTTTPITTLPLSMVTGMDVDRRTGDIWLASYFSLFRFAGSEHVTTLRQQFRQKIEVVRAPKLRQIEAIVCDGRGDVWVTSEGSPAVSEKVKRVQD